VAINNTLDIYRNLVAKSKNVKYNEDVVKRLKAFNYKELKEREGLSGSIYDDVVTHLEKGDIVALYENVIKDCEAILLTLSQVQNGIQDKSTLDLLALWRLNQDYCRSMLRGQYVARVFFEIKTGKAESK